MGSSILVLTHMGSSILVKLAHMGSSTLVKLTHMGSSILVLRLLRVITRPRPCIRCYSLNSHPLTPSCDSHCATIFSALHFPPLWRRTLLDYTLD